MKNLKKYWTIHSFIVATILIILISKYAEAGIKKIPDLPNSATIQNSDLLVFENQATNKTNNILFSDLVANFPIPSLTDLSDVNLSSPLLGDVLHFNGTEWVNTPVSAIAPSNNIYNSNGTLTSNRTLDGDMLDLNFTNVNNFYANSFEQNFVSDDHTGFVSTNGYVNLTANTTGSFSANQNLSLNSGTVVELSAVNEVNLIAPKTTVSKDFYLNDLTPVAQTDILNIDPLSGNVSYVPLSSISPSVQNGISLIGSNVELGGILLHDTSIDGDTNQYNLWLENLGSFFVSSIESQITAQKNIFFNSVLNTYGEAGNNTSFLSVPDWDTSADLEGTIYSGNDVLDLSGIFGANIRGTGFFNSRLSNSVKHYIFAGDMTGTGGAPDNIALGIQDFSSGDNVSQDFSFDVATGNHTMSSSLSDSISQTYYSDSVSVQSKNYQKSFSNSTLQNYYSSDIQIDGTGVIIENLYSNLWNYSKYINEGQYSLNYFSNTNSLGSTHQLLFNDTTEETTLSRTSSMSSELSALNLIKNTATLRVVDSSSVDNEILLDQGSVKIKRLNSATGGEEMLVSDSLTGEVKTKTISSSGALTHTQMALTGSNSYYPNIDELVICAGSGTGLVGDEIYLPSGTSDGQKVIVKINSTDNVRVKSNGGVNNVELGTQYDIDGINYNKPSITFEFDVATNNWTVI